MKLDVILISHGHGSLLVKTLDCLKKSSIQTDLHLTLNIKEDLLTYTQIKNIPLKTLSENEKPLALSINLNRSISKISQPWCVILNPDVEFSPSVLSEALNEAESRQLDVLGLRSLYPDQTEIPCLRRFPKNLFSLLCERLFFSDKRKREHEKILVEQENFWFHGSFILAKTKILQTFPFDERFFLYFEDVEWFLRLQQAKIQIGVSKNLFYVHHFQRKSKVLFSRSFFIHLNSARKYFQMCRTQTNA